MESQPQNPEFRINPETFTHEFRTSDRDYVHMTILYVIWLPESVVTNKARGH